MVFHEIINKQAVLDAVAHPRDISQRAGPRQQAPALDYLVGFNLSPLLGKKSAVACPPAACKARRCGDL